MSDTPLRTGALGLNLDALERDGGVDNPEAGRWACQDARAVWLEVMGPRVERERETDEAQSRSRFL